MHRACIPVSNTLQTPYKHIADDILCRENLGKHVVTKPIAIPLHTQPRLRTKLRGHLARAFLRTSSLPPQQSKDVSLNAIGPKGAGVVPYHRIGQAAKELDELVVTKQAPVPMALLPLAVHQLLE